MCWMRHSIVQQMFWSNVCITSMFNLKMEVVDSCEITLHHITKQSTLLRGKENNLHCYTCQSKTKWWAVFHKTQIPNTVASSICLGFPPPNNGLSCSGNSVLCSNVFQLLDSCVLSQGQLPTSQHWNPAYIINCSKIISAYMLLRKSLELLPVGF
jgi:hypothetical protein